MLRRYGVDFKPVSSNSGVYSFDHFTVLPLECRIASPSDHQNHLQQPLPPLFKKLLLAPGEPEALANAKAVIKLHYYYFPSFIMAPLYTKLKHTGPSFAMHQMVSGLAKKQLWWIRFGYHGVYLIVLLNLQILD